MARPEVLDRIKEAEREALEGRAEDRREEAVEHVVELFTGAVDAQT